MNKPLSTHLQRIMYAKIREVGATELEVREHLIYGFIAGVHARDENVKELVEAVKDLCTKITYFAKTEDAVMRVSNAIACFEGGEDKCEQEPGE